MLHTITCNGSTLCYENTPGVYTGEYYLYCCRLLVQAMKEGSSKVNIIIGPHLHTFDNDNPVVRLDIQPEHTLVKEGGRSVEERVEGRVDTLAGKGKYLVRVPNFDYYNSLDYTIEYSIPNIKNLEFCKIDKFLNYARTGLYIAPVIYDDVTFNSDRREDTISLFSTNPSPRRSIFLQNTDVRNIQNVFSKEKLREVYYNSKVMVNVHQTEHHHTFEELRVLPALCNGVIIVSEEVPLKDYIPYEKAIVWSSYTDLADTVKDVQENYEKYYNKIFTEDLKIELSRLGVNNKKTFKELLCLKTKTTSS